MKKRKVGRRTVDGKTPHTAIQKTLNPTTFEALLDELREKCTNKKTEEINKVKLGSEFEQLVRKFLLNDRVYADRFSDVFLWKNWGHADGPDNGIDLIAVEKGKKNTITAVQCKCYAMDNTVTNDDVSTFLSEVTRIERKFKMTVNVMLATTTYKLSSVAINKLKGLSYNRIDMGTFEKSNIKWEDYPAINTKPVLKLRKHQDAAYNAVIEGFEKNDRGKLIMACGTGKTLTSLRIAEKQAGRGRTVLYMVPSISLVRQTMREWGQNALIPHVYTVVCSDETSTDLEDSTTADLAYPPTTDSHEIGKTIEEAKRGVMHVVFSTYQSSDKISEATSGKYPFDLILCDEAHRTTGIVKKDDDTDTNFTRIHDDDNIPGRKRLYMTATERIYTRAAKKRDDDYKPISMDDKDLYGKTFHEYKFGKAVTDGVLSDYKIRIPVLDEDDYNKMTGGRYGRELIDEEILLGGVWHALNHDDQGRQDLLQRSIAFTNTINASKTVADDQERCLPVVAKRTEKTIETGNVAAVRHIDGTMSAGSRARDLRWLAESNTEPSECRILSNARCLSEGVDVPNLDSIIFLKPRKSQVDVVQAVGRVMRKADNKDWGYVILPILLKKGETFSQSLDDKSAWNGLWQILRALRSHDKRLSLEIDKWSLNEPPKNGKKKPVDVDKKVQIIYMGEKKDRKVGLSDLAKLESKMVEHVGDRWYFDRKSEELGKLAAETVEIISKACMGRTKAARAIANLQSNLQGILHADVSREETIKVLAQHNALSRVFNTLFPKKFRNNNPVAAALDAAMESIDLGNELKKFNIFYDDVVRECEKIGEMEQKQTYVKKIYENFIKGFDPLNQQSQGIVYTPDEVIDFILHSTQDVLKKHFGTSLASKQVKIFDPFTGTGSFITRLLRSGLIRQNIGEKYKYDIWANELSLLAYYVAAVNIESTLGELIHKDIPFKNINYTDTLSQDPMFRADKSRRRVATKLTGEMKKVGQNIRKSNMAHVHVIMGNPPYSAKQSDYNEQNQNVKYPSIDKQIENTYAKYADSGSLNQLYDSYIRSIRWASDRIGNAGVIAFVTNAGFLRSDSGAGVRACLKKEFNEIRCFDLRGNAYTQGEQRKKEGDNIFGEGSRTPVTITILVRNPKLDTKDENGNMVRNGIIHYRNIGDYHDQNRKFEILGELVSIYNKKTIEKAGNWEIIEPDKQHIWFNKPIENIYVPMGNKDAKQGGSSHTMFKQYSLGVNTARDDWAYNSSPIVLANNMKKHVKYCKEEGPEEPKPVDPLRGKWSRELDNKLRKTEPKFTENAIRISLYRPFFKQYVYYDYLFNDMRYKISNHFPNNDTQNPTIVVKGKSPKSFSVFITDITPNLNILSPTQCFPLYTYDGKNSKYNITDSILNEYQKQYGDKKITKEDIFYYTYGLLHHRGYRHKFRNNLLRELPGIPMAPKFKVFCEAGKELAGLHLTFDTCKRYSLGIPKFKPKNFTKLSFGKKKDTNGKNIVDKSVIRMDGVELFSGVPEVNYTVNGRTPVEWILDRYRKTTDKDSGITNDPCTGTDIIAVLERAVHVGLESDRIIKSLPKEFEPKNWKPKVDPSTLDAYDRNNVEVKA